MYQILIGTIICLVIALYAYNKKSLTINGLFGALCMGIVLTVCGGLYFLSLLITFFISSTIAGKFCKHLEKELSSIHQKCGARDIAQVAANGMPALLFAILFYLTGNHIFILGFATGIASSNADTWGSELGVLSKKPTVSILNFKPLRKGLSGGITFAGTMASFAGAVLIAAVFTIGYHHVYNDSSHALLLFTLCLFGGFAGSLLDSVLGATLQVKYYCEAKQMITEKRVTDGTNNKVFSGYPLINNDVVNFASSFIVSLLTVFVYMLLT
ncbi:MAG: DUF92 domain-containing protein [Fibrobacter sp.]|nr:DUF92 domain-containing protein [Fibrobacter sp.]